MRQPVKVLKNKLTASSPLLFAAKGQVAVVNGGSTFIVHGAALILRAFSMDQSTLMTTCLTGEIIIGRIDSGGLKLFASLRIHATVH